MAAGTRKSFTGGGVRTTITSQMNSGASSISITSATGWPAPGSPFVALLDRGTVTEEKILVAARAGTALSSITRGYDGTTDTTHASGASIETALDSNTLDEANRIASLQTTKGDLITFDTSPQRLAVGANGTLLIADSTKGTGQKWGSLATVRLRRAANQSINNNTVTAITWDTEDEDSENLISLGGGLSVLPLVGIWSCIFAVDTTGYSNFGTANGDQLFENVDSAGTAQYAFWPRTAAAAVVVPYQFLARSATSLQFGLTQVSGAAVNFTASLVATRLAL